MHGANAHCGPVALVSFAATCSTSSTSAGSRVEPSPMLCGKMVAPTRLPWPCTVSTPYRIGICSRVVSAAAWKLSTMSAHASGVFGVGTEPPPDSTEPSRLVAISDGSSANAGRSPWVIWPTFSASVIRLTRSRTLATTDSRESRYGRPLASMTTVAAAFAVSTPAVEVVTVTGTVSAVSAVLSAAAATVTVRLAPEAVPAGKVSVPLVAV
jgi:hypothetical protein